MSKNNYKITYAKKNDSEKIIALVHEVIDFSLTKIYPPSAVKWFYDYHSVEHIEEEFDDGADVAVIYKDSELIGTATYYDNEIKRVFIRPQYQRTGLGKLFMDELEGIARGRSKKYVMLYANPKTRGYYGNRGYETISVTAWEMENKEYLAYCTMVKYLEPRGWHIEKAGENDAAEILAGQKKAFYDVAKAHDHMDMPPMSETEREVRNAIQNVSVFIAKAQGKIVGAVRGGEKDGACYISRMWVAPGYQGKGLGHALMYAVEDAFGYLPRYELFTGSKTPRTIAFYEERGYVETCREALRDYELVYMEKMNALDMINI